MQKLATEEELISHIKIHGNQQHGNLRVKNLHSYPAGGLDPFPSLNRKIQK
jgi:hypothetical protein